MPPRVEYALTPLAMTLRGIVGSSSNGRRPHLPQIDEARARYDAPVPGWAAADD